MTKNTRRNRRTSNPDRTSKSRTRAKKNNESFLSGLFSLMVKQCIFSAMIFAALYFIKNGNLPFSETVCSFVKGAVGYEMTVETFMNFATGLLG